MSSLSLLKGGNVSLSKADPGLATLFVGLGWNPREGSGAEFDLDASCFLLDSNGKVRSDGDFVFYNSPNLSSGCGSVKHTGDNRTGEGDGDDESIVVELNKLDQSVVKLVFVVTIHEAGLRKQNFGQVDGAFIRMVNKNTGNEIARYDLAEDYGLDTAVVFGEVYRRDSEWKFRAIGQGMQSELGVIAKGYGVDV